MMSTIMLSTVRVAWRGQHRIERAQLRGQPSTIRDAFTRIGGHRSQHGTARSARDVTILHIIIDCVRLTTFADSSLVVSHFFPYWVIDSIGRM